MYVSFEANSDKKFINKKSVYSKLCTYPFLKQNTRPSARSELTQYNAESVADLDTDTIECWKAQQLTYPLLTKLVRKRFPMVATSIPSERLCWKCDKSKKE